MKSFIECLVIGLNEEEDNDQIYQYQCMIMISN